MKQFIYGTVSALALLLAVHGAQAAETDLSAAVAASAQTVAGNVDAVSLDAVANEIDRNAFAGASGAFNVGQNVSSDSTVQQSLAIAANAESGGGGVDGNRVAAAAAEGAAVVTHNLAAAVAVLASNEIEDNAFAYASGAFQVLQNASANSAVSQSLAISAVADGDDARALDAAVSTSDLAAAVTHNVSYGTIAAANNLISNNAFSNARGAFNVLQNASVNSSVQQGISISALR